jgi:hypothetical protein
MMNSLLKQFTICFLIPLSTFSQRQEIGIDIRSGATTNHLFTKEVNDYNQFDYKKMVLIHDNGFNLSYKYTIWKKIKLMLSGGVEYSSSRYSFPIIDLSNSYRHLADVKINQNRFVIRFGVVKQFHFFDSKFILELGLHAVDKYYPQRTKNYTSDFITSKEEWIKYKYDIDTYAGKYYTNDNIVENKGYMYLNLDYSTQLKFKIREKMYLNLSFNYSRNNVIFYNYTTWFEYYQNGSQTPTGTSTDIGLQGNFDPKFGKRDHNIYLGLGISYKLD